MFVVGTQLGKYTLRRKLGQGGFGQVFAAYDESLDREVALKILNAEHKASDDVMRRFLQEARLAARIGHPGIVTVFECAQIANTNTDADGIAYIAMELLDGESLAHRLHRSGRMSPATAMEITRQIASALEAAHAHGVVHRDLKPDNIFLVKDPAVLHGERVKVLDFGIAKLHHLQSSGVQTSTNEVFGTPRYMSPEQCRSSTQIDARSDIYTLGCILFELLTGRPPFVGQTGELFAQHLMVEAPSVLAFVRETPYHVVDLVQRMLAKEVEARPPTMADVQRELEAGGAVAVGIPATVPPGLSAQLPVDNDSTLKAAAGVSMLSSEAGPRTPRTVIAAAAGIALLLAIALVFWLRGSGDDGVQDTRVAAAKPQVTPIEESTGGPSKAGASNADGAAMTGGASPSADGAAAKTGVASNADGAAPGDRAAASPAGRDAASNGGRAAKSGASSADAGRAAKHGGAVSNADGGAKPGDASAEAGASSSDVASRAGDAKASRKSRHDSPAGTEAPRDKKIVNPFEAAGTGTLVLRSSPACEILVDGKAIAKTTPQDLKLAAGKHRITLVQDELDIKETFVVEIRANETERVNRDLHEKIKAKKRNATINPFGGGT